ncbi:MAG: orotidine-5'-phosphate decarboxylase [Chloroflexota bacterium]|nr:orotidine-5'-phosphate decarboxylase [Chloroflexota bacterium]
MSARTITTFRARLDGAVAANDSLLCVGLDPELAKLPAALHSLPVEEALTTFVHAIIAATADLVCCYKPNLAFYLAHGAAGWHVLLGLREIIPAHIPMLLDAKYGDIGSTAAMYARAAFDVVRADAVTVSPYVGGDALAPFFARDDRAAFVLCKTSNSGSGDVQDLLLASGEPVSLRIAARIRDWGAARRNVGAVVGATYPAEMAAIRAAIPDAPILVPGIGAQGGDLEGAVRAGMDRHGAGILVSASRSVLYASSGEDYADAARAEAVRLRDAINAARQGG